MKKISISRKVFIIFNYSLMVVVSLSCILPFVHLFALSLSDKTAVSAGKVVFLPVDFTLSAYEYDFKKWDFLRGFLNSIVRVILGTGTNLVLMLLTAYPLSKDKSKLLGRNVYMAYFFITMLVGGGLIPTYLVVVRLGLRDSIWSLILPGALPVYNMVILMNFIRSLPGELQEAARIDGASELKLLYKILLPLLKPSLATVGLFSIIGHWNEWFSAIIYMQDRKKYPLATYLQTLLRNFAEIMNNVGSDYEELISMLNVQTGRAAQLFLASIPVLIAYPFLQKYFTAGLTLGSVKG
ncbi:MAG: carbohydrate ABC transporter permease [Lachnospiraceae bacterium]|nr:carbohydrate ABC transporter permease [Lachnospiraceae bacterium]